MSELKQTAFGQGFSARENGVERERVPFAANTIDWLEWLSGYDMAFDVGRATERAQSNDPSNTKGERDV